MSLPVDAVADAVLSEMAPPAGYDDDIAMVIYRHQQAPFRIESEASAEQLVDIRHRLAAWLRAADVPEGLVADIVLAINEACTNSVEHAYRGHQLGHDAARGRSSQTARSARGSPTRGRGRHRPPNPATVGGAWC